MTHETLTSSQLSVQAAALRMVHLPLSVYGSLAQVSLLGGVGSCLLGVVFFSFSFSVRTGKLVASTIALSGGFQIPEYDATTGLDFIYLAPSLT